MVLRVTDVKPLEGYRLRISFNDGVVREVDFAPELEHAEGTLVEALRDADYFRQVRVDEDARTIAWPNGLEPDPEVLHGDFEPAPSHRRSVAPSARFR